MLYVIFFSFGQVDENEDADIIYLESLETGESASEMSRTSSPFPDPPFVSNPTTPSSRKRKLDDAKDAEQERELFHAAMARLSSPREKDDDFKAFGRSVGFDLRKIDNEAPNQCKIAKKIIGEVLFMASMDMLNVNSKVIN